MQRSFENFASLFQYPKKAITVSPPFFPENRSMRLGFVQSRSVCKKIPVYRNPKNESLQAKTCQIDEKNGQN